MAAKIISISLSIPPEWLPARAKEHWERFYNTADSVREVLPADIMALASLVDAWAEYWEMRQYLADNGNTCDMELRPEYWLMSEACKRAFEGMNRFGLTPMGRAEMGD